MITSLSVDLTSTRLWCFEAFVRPVHRLRKGWNWPWPLQEEACLSLFTHFLLISVEETVMCCQTKGYRRTRSLEEDISTRQQMWATPYYLIFVFSNSQSETPFAEHSASFSLTLTHSRNSSWDRICLNSWLLSSIKGKTMSHLETIRRG